jgi:hypothetical protein
MFTVTVQDTQAPVITCPAPITVPNAANQCGAVVSFSPVVQGPCDDVTAICLPVSGTLFSVGQTLVTCYAQSATGPQSLPCTFTVTVLDTQVPVILCPSPSVANATNPVGTVVLYAVTVTDNCPGAIINCTPASGSLFPIGDTTVHCTATDASAHQASCSFNIHVKGAKEQLNDLIALVQGMSAIKPSIRNALLVNLNASLAGLMANNTSTACGALQSFINLVNGQRDKFITSSDADYLVGKATQIRAVIGCK